MFSLTGFAKRFIEDVLACDGVAADFTMGNGHDTLYLCKALPSGHVYSFDIQEQAVENTRKRLEEAGVSNATLIHASHALADEYIKEPLDCVLFNLGYLPGSDKKIHTMCDTTLIAVKKAMELLKPSGRIIIMVYPGHEEGTREGQVLSEFLASLDRRLWLCASFSMINSPDSPFIILVEKYKTDF